MNISKITVNRWLQMYRLSLEKLTDKIYSNKVYEQIKEIKKIKLDKKLSNLDVIQFLLKILDKNPFLLKKEMIIMLTNQFNMKFNINKISLLLTKIRYTYKKPRQYIVKNSIFINKLIEDRENFKNNIKQKPFDKIISIDESGINKLENSL